MKQKIQLLVTGALVILSVVLSSFTTIWGGDHYRIYINDKLIVEQFMHKPTVEHAIDLSNTKSNDQLVVHYSHCGEVGKSRIVGLKDAKGNIVKQWKFADAKTTGMRLPVNELINAADSKKLVLFYTSKELPNSIALASLRHTSAVVKK